MHHWLRIMYNNYYKQLLMYTPYTQCNRTTSIEALFKQVSRGPNDSDTPVKLAVLGAGCSVATEPTAEISHFFNLPQVSVVIPSVMTMRNDL